MNPKPILALTFDSRHDGWNRSRGFVKREISMPTLREKENPQDAFAIILRVQYAGLCGTDLGIWKRDVFRDLIHNSLKREKKTLRMLGHEFVGEVIQAGSRVKRLGDIRAGDTVSGDSHITCGNCFQCTIGEQEVCQEQMILGVSTDGIFAHYVKLPAKNLVRINTKRIRPQVAAIMDPFGNAVHACSKTNLQGKYVLVLGCGPIGLFTILLARTFGAKKIIAADQKRSRLITAKKLGAHEIVFVAPDTTKTKKPLLSILQKKIYAYTQGRGADVVFEMAGTNSSVVSALALARSGGHVVLFGLKDGDFLLPRFHQIITKGLTLHGVVGRKIFDTWHASERILSKKRNGVQDAIWRVILREGKGTILPIKKFSPALWEKKLAQYPKILIHFS